MPTDQPGASPIISRLIASLQSGKPVPLDEAFKAVWRLHQNRMGEQKTGEEGQASEKPT